MVTSFLYRAHPVSTVLGGVIAYARDQAAAMLRYYRDFMPAAPDELTAYAGLISMPDGTPAVGVMADPKAPAARPEVDLKHKAALHSGS
jgi:hypothetical protein